MTYASNVLKYGTSNKLIIILWRCGNGTLTKRLFTEHMFWNVCLQNVSLQNVPMDQPLPWIRGQERSSFALTVFWYEVWLPWYSVNSQRSAIFKRLVIAECAAIWPIQAAGTAWQGFPPISQAKLLVILLSTRTRNEQQLWEEEVPARSEEELATVGLARPNSQQIFPWQGGKR